jgi:hypothetical protein
LFHSTPLAKRGRREAQRLEAPSSHGGAPPSFRRLLIDKRAEKIPTGGLTEVLDEALARLKQLKSAGEVDNRSLLRGDDRSTDMSRW